MNTVARVVCLVEKIRIADLSNRVLRRGETIMVAENQARASSDLQRHRREGKVRVTYLRGVQKSPRGKAHTVAWNRPPQSTYRRNNQKTKPSVDEGAIRAIVAEEVAVQVEALKNDLIGHLVGHMDDLRKDIPLFLDRAISDLKDHIDEGMVSVAPAPSQPVKPAVSTPHLSTWQEVEDDWPQEELVFVPTGIVKGDDGDSSISLSSEVSGDDSGGVDDAAQALRALRKAKKKS